MPVSKSNRMTAVSRSGRFGNTSRAASRAAGSTALDRLSSTIEADGGERSQKLLRLVSDSTPRSICRELESNIRATPSQAPDKASFDAASLSLPCGHENPA